MPDNADCLSKIRNVVPSCEISTCIENVHGNADDEEHIVNSNIYFK